MKMEGHFIHDKIAIPPVKPRISRPRLLRLLSENLSSANATVLVGRAGTGKTTLAADFARLSGRAVAWYKVDATDGDLRVFCQYLITAIRLQRPAIRGDQLLDLCSVLDCEHAELLAEALVFQLAERKGEPLLIVIEDLHLVYDSEWVVRFFRRLLPLLPREVHALITCRILPPAPLWRLRSKQMLQVLDETELAFTLDEAIDLFESYGLSREHARIARSQTNGKAAAISEFASTPGRPGRAVADRVLLFRGAQMSSSPDFQV
jgi:LuxR family maltose regulon positive regulatory protein